MTMMLTPNAPTKRVNEAQRELGRRARLELARQKLIDFCVYVDPSSEYRAIYQNTHHLNYLAAKLEAVERGEVKRLMIFTVNRHLKSSLITMKFPPWFIGRRVEQNKPHQVMIVSHTQQKSFEFSGYARDLVRDTDFKGKSRYKEVFPHVQISRTSQGAGEWGLLTPDGFEEGFPALTAGSMAAPPTGSGADLLIIDDPVKNSQEARSASTQQLHLANWREGLRTRLNSPEAAVILVMTRWHVNDIAGQLLKLAKDDPQADQWDVVILPALAYTSKEREAARRMGIPVPDDDPLGREPGAALWPERFPREHHLTTKANGPTAFASIAQQLPIPETGNLLSRDSFKYLEAPPKEHIRWVIAVDAAFAEKQLAKDDPDFNVVGLLGFWMPDGVRVNMSVVMASLVRTQQGLTMGKEMITRFALTMQELLGGFRPPIIGDQATLDRILFNDLRGNPQLAQWSIRSLADPHIKHEVGAFTGDKVSRFEPWRDRAEAGRFYLVDEAWSAYALRQAFAGADKQRLLGDEPLAWHEKFYAEVEGFPDWPNDDMVDMVSTGYHVSTMKAARQKKAGSYQG